MKNFVHLLSVIIFFVGIFFFSRMPVIDYDLWYHLKSGEMITKVGIIHHDVFSQTASGREWFPHEWLYQVGAYRLGTTFGLGAIRIFMAGIITILIAIFLYVLIRILYLPILSALVFGFFFYASIYDFLSTRPHMIAYTFFTLDIAIILTYIARRINFLWLTIPITIVWSNIHSSAFLSVYLFLAYAGTSILSRRLKHAKVLGLYGVLLAVLTILPPLGFTQYRLLALFYDKRAIVGRFLSEWVSITTQPSDIWTYAVTGSLVTLLFILVSLRKKTLSGVWIVLPLVPFALMPFFAIRNIFFGYFFFVIVLGWTVAELLKGFGRNYWAKRIVTAGVVILGFISVWLLSIKYGVQSFPVPQGAVKFIQTYRSNGPMYHSFDIGGYLLYQLYPEYKVFIDGRADVYLCCEIPDLMRLFEQKNLPDQAYALELGRFFEKYHFSFAVLSASSGTWSARVARLLHDDFGWYVVYWDDDFQILVANDGRNRSLVEEFGAVAATPYGASVAALGKEDQAIGEYQHMIRITDSGRSRSALGTLLLQKNRFDEAQKEFEKAIAIRPEFDSPYMNLGELAVRSDNFGEAVRLYEKALVLNPSRGFIYIRLGQLYLDGLDNRQKARSVWQKGLNISHDPAVREKLESLLQVL